MIHQFDGRQWQPGPDRRDGPQPFPAQPVPGLFFNDVTGAQGDSADAVAEGLPQLLMKQGALAAWLPAPFDWRGLMDRVLYVYSMKSKVAVNFAQVVIRPDETRLVQPASGWDASLVTEASDLAWALVRANGQMDFIRRQPWFRDGSHEVVLHLIVQWGRSVNHLEFHKDCVGKELFVNLMFRSDLPLPATEWSVDLEEMSAAKREVLKKHWPTSLLDAMADARRALAPAADAPPLRIEGGMLLADGCMSWVDELVWHSIPVLAHRRKFTLDEVMSVLSQRAFSNAAYEVIAQIAQTGTCRFARRMAADGIALESLSEDFVHRLWELCHGDKGWAGLMDEWVADARDIDWSARPRDCATGLTLAQPSEPFDQMKPTGMQGRPRSNSLDLQALLAQPGSRQSRKILSVVVSVQPAT